ncbi:zinc-binding dehydrogenase [Vitiosangium sp. GDMCC 1.1324]|uniref:MDR/zinc-dependent alcohol dehydrogenase-like family protein n=1 Tax=Vitiosangium sp. (strain GDMCC 1.1324) TaxID=2138576 RepID=UPI000D368432|nr:zinc-binding dehydrogenase [Vitiosangium sp. GDMCC 1.1324]PTL81389.1 L-iditol 2-dehydrogenase [Vitiosangium sp. GDMCC 1.1324]
MNAGMSNATMAAAVIAAPKKARVERVARPEPGPNSVRVKLEGCGLGGSNLLAWEGREWFRYPMHPGAPGREGWGVVDAVGSGVTGLKVGDRVATLSSAACAEYDVVKTDSAVLLPPSLAGKPFPGEPLGCAMNIFRRGDIQSGQTVAIIGIGFLGALVTRLAVNAGARVLAISRRPYALGLARAYGASECIPMDDHSRIVERVKSLTKGGFCERVIEVVGEQWPLDLAGELTRERGRLIIAGYHQDGPRRVNMQLWNWRGLDVINAHERDPKVYVEGIRLAVDEIASGRLDPFPLFTHRFGLDELDLAFEMMRMRPDGFLKALITV